MGTANKLKLGVFSANISSGVNATLVPERWSASWDDNLRLAQMTDEYGFEFFLPVGRWRGYDGPTLYQATCLETITWASALLAATKRIFVFGTVHTPLFHPLVAAKQMVTADQVGHGRFGLNIVVGSKEDEFAMFGIPLAEHEDRYAQGQEWITIVRRLWTEPDDFDFNGAYYQLKGARSLPKTYGGTTPILLNAGTSPTGRAFALRNCDAFFTAVHTSNFDEATGIVTPDISGVKAVVDDLRSRAAEYGRKVGVYTNVNVICRPTQKEAIEYYRYALVEQADWVAVDAQLQQQGIPRDLDSPDYLRRRQNLIRRIPAIGDPDAVARMFISLSEIGFDGIGITLLNYLDELPLIRQEVVPRLEAAGLRFPT